MDERGKTNHLQNYHIYTLVFHLGLAHQSMASMIAASLLIFSLLHLGNALRVDYYAKTCPGAELAVTAAVKKAMASDNAVPAALLRMHFHDCFIRVPLRFLASSAVLSDWLKGTEKILDSVTAGLWCFCVAELQGGRQSREGWASQRLAPCFLRHRPRQEGSGGAVPERGFLCRYLGFGS